MNRGFITVNLKSRLKCRVWRSAEKQRKTKSEKSMSGYDWKKLFWVCLRNFDYLHTSLNVFIVYNQLTIHADINFFPCFSPSELLTSSEIIWRHLFFGITITDDFNVTWSVTWLELPGQTCATPFLNGGRMDIIYHISPTIFAPISLFSSHHETAAKSGTICLQQFPDRVGSTPVHYISAVIVSLQFNNVRISFFIFVFLVSVPISFVFVFDWCKPKNFTKIFGSRFFETVK